MDTDAATGTQLVTQDPPPGAVLAGIDGSELDALVLTAATAEALRCGAPLHVRHVREGVDPLALAGAADLTYAAVELPDDATRVLTVARETVRTLDADVPLTLDHPMGRAENQLVDASETARLVVVGTGRKSALAELVLGTVALNVAAHAHSPVLVVPPGADPDGEGDVVVGVDGSEHSGAALEVGLDQARRRGDRMVVLTTWNVQVIDGYVVTEPTSPEWRQVEDRLHTMQETLLEGLDTDGVEVELRTIKGGIRAQLTEATDGASVLVLGNRGRGGFRSKALGSVTMDLMRRSACPVLVVHADR